MGDINIHLETESGRLAAEVMNHCADVPNDEWPQVKQFVIDELRSNAHVFDTLMWGLRANYLLRRGTSEEEYYRRRGEIYAAAVEKHGAVHL